MCGVCMSNMSKASIALGPKRISSDILGDFQILDAGTMLYCELLLLVSRWCSYMKSWSKAGVGSCHQKKLILP